MFAQCPVTVVHLADSWRADGTSACVLSVVLTQQATSGAWPEVTGAPHSHSWDNAAPTACCPISGNPSTDLAVHHQKTGPPCDSIKQWHLQSQTDSHNSWPFIPNLIFMEFKGIYKAVTDMFLRFFKEQSNRCTLFCTHEYMVFLCGNLSSSKWFLILAFSIEIQIIALISLSLQKSLELLTLCKWYSQLSLHLCFGTAEGRLAVRRTKRQNRAPPPIRASFEKTLWNTKTKKGPSVAQWLLSLWPSPSS